MKRAVPRVTQTAFRAYQERREVGRHGVIGVDGTKQVAPPDYLSEGSRPQRRQMTTDLLGEESEKCDDVFGCTGELGPQVLPLGGDPYWTCVEVALPDHLATHGQQRQGAETEALGAQQGRHNHVTAGAETSVRLQSHDRTQSVGNQH